MKKFLSLLLFAVLSVGAAMAQDSYDFSGRLAKLYPDLPAAFGGGMSMTEVSYDGDNVVYTYTIDESKIMFEAIEGQKDMFNAVFIDELISAKDPVTIEVRDAVIANDKGIVHHFQGSKSGKSFDIKISADEIR